MLRVLRRRAGSINREVSLGIALLGAVQVRAGPAVRVFSVPRFPLWDDGHGRPPRGGGGDIYG